jgi:hypothetical protein
MHRSLVFPAASLLAFGVYTYAASTNNSRPAPVASPARDASADVRFESTVEPFLKKNCLGCHNDKAKVGGLSLTQFHTTADVVAHRDLWERVVQRVKASEMPPKGMRKPEASDVASFTGWIEQTFDDIDRKTPADPGRLTAHRLNRFEYNNAVHDLFGIDYRPAEDFPADDSGYGFDNIGDVLSVSPVLMEKYLAAAERVAKRVIPTDALPKPTRERLTSEHRHKYTPTPVGFYTKQKFANEADYEIRAGISGNREPLRVTLLVDNVAVASEDIDGIDEENPRFLSYKLRVTAGEHRLGARLERRVLVRQMGNPPDLRFVQPKPRSSKQPPPATPWIDYIELRGPYSPLPAPPSEYKARLFTCAEKTEACAGQILRSVAYKAWRRPITDADVRKLTRFVNMALTSGDSFDQGIRLGLEAILVSPDFLFRVERDPDPMNARGVHAVNDYELASRLSFFLWSSIPDRELLQAAQNNSLHKPAVLKSQVARMLKDPKSERFVDNFAGQWLELRNLDSITPDPDKFPEFVDLRDDMKTETRMFFSSVMRDDRSILDFIDGKYSFLNERLAKHYGIKDVKGNDFRRVALENGERSGVLTQGSVLTVSSYPTRTSPVIRGKWVLENFLNAPPPPPPPNVPTLDTSEVGSKMSLREQLEKHRANAICSSCHSKMDPLGFGLENFNAIGQWRDKDGKFAIDSSGTLPDGKSFKGPAELKAILRSDPRAFAQCLAEKMMTYALGRGLERYDRPAVKKIVARAAADDYKFAEFISGIVESLPFQMRRGEGERNVTQTVAQTHTP